MIVSFFQMKRYNGFCIKTEVPILGILLVDFFNFYNSLELLHFAILPFLPNDYISNSPILPKEIQDTFIQIRGE